MPCIERFQEKDYDEILEVLNESFSNMEVPAPVPHKADFLANLPIMWTREHDYPSRHLGVREDGKIVSLLGVYPLPSVIAGEKVLLGTIGNVASLPSARGKGYMKQMMSAALQEAERLDLAAARLGGLRSRYNRYGFDHAGIIYNCRLTRRNVGEYGEAPALRFLDFVEKDEKAVAFARKCQRRNAIYVERETNRDFYCTLRAWKNIPYLAVDAEGRPAGYLSVSPDGKSIAEWGVREGLTAADLTAAYLVCRPELEEAVFQVMPFDRINLLAAFAHCENWTSQSPSLFHVFQWDKLVYPLMKLAAETGGLADGDLTVEIEGWGKLHMSVAGGAPSVKKTEEQAEIVLPVREAINWFFGDLPAICPISRSRAEAGWFPLPLSWNCQDRV